MKQPPKNAGMLCPVQFIRKSKNRTEPCAAVLHKEKLYLTSERRKEIISIVDVETALLTQDNGIMLAYREQGKFIYTYNCNRLYNNYIRFPCYR